MKKAPLFIFSFLLFISCAVTAHAQGYVPLAPISGLTDVQPDAAGLTSFFNNLYKYLIGLSAVLAVIMIVWGGLEISTQDSISKQGAGREKIQGALFGLALILSPVLIFSIINPRILNLSIGLDSLSVNSPSSIFSLWSGSQQGSASGSATFDASYTQSCSQYTKITVFMKTSTRNTCADVSGATAIDQICCSSAGRINTSNLFCCNMP